MDGVQFTQEVGGSFCKLRERKSPQMVFLRQLSEQIGGIGFDMRRDAECRRTSRDADCPELPRPIVHIREEPAMD